MRIELDNHPVIKSICFPASRGVGQNNLDHKDHKEKNMTEHVENPLGFEIKETVTTTGYVDKAGKFVPVEEARELQTAQETTFVQDAEDEIQ
jgi:hypothetical protein